MTRINDITDLVRILREHPDWLDVIRGILFSRDMLNLPIQVTELVELVTEDTRQTSELIRLVSELTMLMGELAQQTGENIRLTGELAQQTGENIRFTGELAQHVTGLAQQVAGLAQQVTGLAQHVTGLTQQATGFAEQVTGLTEQVAGLTQQVTGLAEQVTGLAQHVTGLAEQVAGLAEQVAGLAEQVTGLAEQVTGLAQAVQENQRASQQESERVHRRLNLIDGRLGNLEGSDFERKVRYRVLSRARSRFGLDNPYLALTQNDPEAPQLSSAIARAVNGGAISREEADDLADTDIIVSGQDNRHVAAEVSLTAGNDDIARAKARAEALSKATGGAVTPLVVTTVLDGPQHELAIAEGVATLILPYP